MNDFTLYKSIKLKKLFNSNKTKRNATIIFIDNIKDIIIS